MWYEKREEFSEYYIYLKSKIWFRWCASINHIGDGEIVSENWQNIVPRKILISDNQIWHQSILPSKTIHRIMHIIYSRDVFLPQQSKIRHTKLKWEEHVAHRVRVQYLELISISHTHTHAPLVFTYSVSNNKRKYTSQSIFHSSWSNFYTLEVYVREEDFDYKRRAT